MRCGQIAVIGGVLDHAFERHVFDDLELSHLNVTFAISGFGVNPSPKSSTSISFRISTSALPFGDRNGARLTNSIASSFGCGRNARGRKAVERQIKRLASEATQFFPTCERLAASSAC
jgi:hypothetical protein